MQNFSTLTSKKTLRDSPLVGHEYDLAIVTALHSPELRSIRNLPGSWLECRLPNDSTLYYRGSFKSHDKLVRVVVASAHQMGMAAAAVLSMKIIHAFRPRVIAACGIAAGNREAKTGLGDILIADQAWDYESGKHKSTAAGHEFLPDPHTIALNPWLKEALMPLIANRSFVSSIEKGWNSKRPSSELNVHIGPLASGASVMADDNIFKKLTMQSRKVIGLDMETYGVFYAAENSTTPRPMALSVKSVCDFASADKNDNYQEYAAYTSAHYLHHFALSHPGNTLPSDGAAVS